MALIEHLAQGAWQATEWTWTPGRRASSHSWEARRITLLMQQIAAMEATQPIDTSTSDSVDVTSAWQAILRGRAGEIAAGIYSWQSDGMCLHMKRSTADELPFPLPYARDDARLEQRVAFQIRLTQRYPQASWLTLFRLLPAPPKMPYRSSKYEAIWNEQATVIGQLWIKRKNQRNPVCVRVDVALPLKKGGPKGDAVNMPIALVIDRELTALAHAWAN